MVHVHVVTPLATTAATPRAHSSARYTRLPAASFNTHLEAHTRKQVDTPIATTAAKQHVVERGDTLWGIVKNHIRESGQSFSQQQVADAVNSVARQNGMANPNLIQPGQAINLSGIGIAGTGSLEKAATAPATVAVQAEAVKAVPPVRSGAHYTLLKPAEGGPVIHHKARIFDVFRRNKKAATKTVTPPTTAKPSSIAARPAYTKPLGGTGRLSSNFGPRKDPFTGKSGFHNGIDVAARKGTPIFPFRPGTVTYSGYKGGYGNVVVVKHDDGLESVYGHASKTLVKAGTKVTEKTMIGLVGSTGRSTGPHLHFEVREQGNAVNPLPHLEHDHGNTSLAKN